MTSGAEVGATQVMIFSVYGVDDALWIVRLQSGFSVEGTRSGYIVPNSRITSAATTLAVHAKAQPSPVRRHTSMTAVNCATTAIPTTMGVQLLLANRCVHSPNAATSAVSGSDNHVANRNASSRTGPSVLSAMNTAPWKPNSMTVVNPPSTVYALNTSPSESWTCLCASTGSPRTSIAKAMPHRIAGRHEPTAIPTSAKDRHFGSSILPRHSIA